jgi:hypothetical protein
MMTARFEARVAELLNEQATWEQPPARVTVGTAIRRGNSRLRWQRGGLAGACALTGAAAVAIALTGAAPFGGNLTAQNSGTAPQAATSGPSAQTGSLPVLRTDARFGWLPVGEKLTSGFESDNYAFMNVTAGKGNRVLEWTLTIWAPGWCARRSSANQGLLCRYPGGGAPASYRLDGRALSTHGHEAFWISDRTLRQEITWEYAPGAWAQFESPPCCSAVANRQPVAALLRIARGISFGPARGQPIRFDVQLTGVPSDWRVSDVGYGLKDGSLLGISADLTGDHGPRTGTSFNIMKGGVGNADPCWSSAAGPTKHTVLRGYDVQSTTNPVPLNNPSHAYELCAPDVHGIAPDVTATAIDITTGKDSGRTPTELFEHMRLLGTNPADWVANPIG